MSGGDWKGTILVVSSDHSRTHRTRSASVNRFMSGEWVQVGSKKNAWPFQDLAHVSHGPKLHHGFSHSRLSTCTVDSRYSGSLKHGHLDIPAIWLGTECKLYVYCTKLALKYGHSLFRIPASACWLSQTRFFQCNFIRVLRLDMTFEVWFSK